jgi:NlpC/P60 family putative phage cell wall peptidase
MTALPAAHDWYADYPWSKRRELVAEAYSWLGTPYHNLGDLKGVGVDCAMLLVRAFQAAGLVPDFDPRPYEPEWFLHRDEERYLAGMEKYSKRIDPEATQPGDILVYRFGRTASHGAIVVSDDLMIHAYRPLRAVVLQERRALLERFDSAWSVF